VPVGQLVAHMSGDSPSGASAGSDSGSLDAKLKHLEFIQGVIARMSNSSFLFKGWAITIAAGLSAFAATSSQSVLRVALIGAIVSSVLFWGLDGYYLWIEHRYVALYKTVASKEPDKIDFSMVTEKSKPACNWLTSCRRPHLVSFYGLIVIGEVVGLLLIKGK
jgi:hypothetical protein